MKVWRVCKARRASTAFDGEGAKITGGRWNPIGTPVVYTSANLATAILETLVHLDKSSVPKDYVRISAEIPASVKIERISIADLPSNWDTFPAPAILQDMGEAWLISRKSLVLAVPSATCPEELNYLINPKHPSASKLKISAPIALNFDRRLFL